MCTGMFTDMCTDMFTDRCADMLTDRCTDICTKAVIMSAASCAGVPCTHPCVRAKPVRRTNRHADERVVSWSGRWVDGQADAVQRHARACRAMSRMNAGTHTPPGSVNPPPVPAENMC